MGADTSRHSHKSIANMKFISTTFLAAVFVGFVSAQQNPPIIAITSPLMGTKYKAGQQAILSWVNPKVPSISQIVLARGPSTGLQPITVLAQNVNTADGKYIWKIPENIESGDDYAFECGTSPDIAFAGPFSIEGSSGGSTNSSNSSSAATPASASASASASSLSASHAATLPSSSTSTSTSAPNNVNKGSLPSPATSNSTVPATASANKLSFPAASGQPLKTSSASTVECYSQKALFLILGVAMTQMF
ncbi:hypothetical protein BDF14DRAFT_1993685 [Spinellus fusiger]|nr:hypothetical protein BDF14DRAFT_1993685 [Spinellus fusiger]